ncbi:hypothetical protein TWF718_005362 [Orbilia javanica]|uniref:BTB domain-containing protein n=1 Tax=Orbilia javanica TaxID=47235 RepID=A0AAN8N1B5_9PEZI
MASALPNSLFQQYFNNNDYADIIVELKHPVQDTNCPKSTEYFPMHQIIACSTSTYFKEACFNAETNPIGTKLLFFDISLEAFTIIAAWVYGFRGSSFERLFTEKSIRGVMDFFIDHDLETDIYPEMQELRTLLLKNLFKITTEAEVASATGSPRMDLRSLEDICEYCLPGDRNTIRRLVKQQIPQIKCSAGWLEALAGKSAAGFLASILLEIYQEAQIQ